MGENVYVGMRILRMGVERVGIEVYSTVYLIFTILRSDNRYPNISVYKRGRV